jgi:TRAP-type C4-dicarboxylate transport system permease small subunit
MGGSFSNLSRVGRLVRVDALARGGAAVGAVALVAIMLLVVSNIIARFFNKVIAGTYETVMLTVVVVAAFAVSYAALKQAHISIRIVVSRFSSRTQAILTIITSAIGACVWAVVAWASVSIIPQKLELREYSEMLHIPYLPFRCAFVIGLLLFCSVLLVDLVQALKLVVKK